MKLTQQAYLGIKVRINQTPETPEEFADSAKDKDMLLKLGIQHVLFHGGVASDAREAICAFVEKHTGVERKYEEVLDKEGNAKVDTAGEAVIKYTESEMKYVNRALEESGTSLESLQAAWDATEEGQNGFVFDASKREREAGTGTSKKPGKANLEAAAKVLADANSAEIISKLEAANPNTKLARNEDGTVSQESLANLIKAHLARVQEEAKKAAGLV